MTIPTLAEFWIPLTVFALVAAFTPGPNNLMLAASGMNYGFRATVPHMVGVSLGFPVMLLCITFGTGALFAAFPPMRYVMKILSAAFIIYFAWKIATADTDLSLKGGARPLTAWQAALFQWVNPKGWAVAVAVASLYAPGGIHDWGRAIYMTALFFAISVVCTSCYTSLGTVIRSILRDVRVRRWVNRGMAVALILTMIPILMRGTLA